MGRNIGTFHHTGNGSSLYSPRRDRECRPNDGRVPLPDHRGAHPNDGSRAGWTCCIETHPFAKGDRHRLARRLVWGDRDAATDRVQEAWLALLLTPARRWAEPCYVRSVTLHAVARWLAEE